MSVPTILRCGRSLPARLPDVSKETVDGCTVYRVKFEPKDLVNYAEALFYFRDKVQQEYNVDMDVTKVKTHRTGNHLLSGFEYRVDDGSH